MITADVPTTGLVDLHRHLDGSMRAETLAELAEEAGVALPADLRFHAGMGLDQALACFATSVATLQSPAAIRRVAAEMCEDAEAEGVSTLEIRFAPQLHRRAPMEAYVDAAVEGAAGRAGFLLCGLYGDPPELIDALVDIAASRDGVLGIDLAGGPMGGHSWRLEDYAEPFARARRLGLGRTVHASEGRPPGEIRVAIEQLGAQRIGHGTTLLDDPAVLDLVLSREICIEACPTSNVHVGAITEVAAHPVAEWLARGVRVCVCADNTLFSQTTAAQELARVRGNRGIGPSEIQRLIANGHAAAFPGR